MPTARLAPKKIIMQILDSGKVFTLKEIYKEFEKRVKLPLEKIEVTYERPKYTHTIRATLTSLVKQKKVVRVGKGKYKSKLNEDRFSK
jgi:hypothetical protein